MPALFRRPLFWLVVLITLVVLSIGAFMASKTQQKPVASTAAKALDTPFAAIAAGKVDVDGGVIQVAARTAGVVREVLVQEGDLVKKGDVLARLKDDQLQLSQLGRPVDLRFTATDGTKVDLGEERGKVTAVIFWSAESAPSLVWMGYFAKYADGVLGLRVVTVSVDRNQADLDAAMHSLHLLWPTAFDGQGWQNAIARKYGINTLPTLWLIDRKGNLAFLNARENYQLKINELLLNK